MNREVILLRHAARDAIPFGKVGNDISLNAYGKNESYKYGQKLNKKIVSYTSSSIKRCIQTAKKINEGTESGDTIIKLSSSLGDPGIFITDGAIAWNSWEKYGTAAVNEYFLIGQDQWPGFANFNVAAISLLKMIHQQLVQLGDNETAIWVTHDTILAAFISHLAPKPLKLNEWPDYLASVHIREASQNILQLSFNEQVWKVSI